MNNCYKFENLPLPYKYNALEPYIDEKTMMLHHDRHLQTYIDNLNAVLEDCPKLQKLSLTQLICKVGEFPPKIQAAVRNNAGGVYNHRFYFNGMGPCKDKEPYGALKIAIDNCFCSYDEFKNQFKEAAVSVFGSGYAWLVLTPCKKLKIVTTANQDTPIVKNCCPILTIDVWEHAYYLKHYNKRAGYIDDWFNVINFERAEKIFKWATEGSSK